MLLVKRLLTLLCTILLLNIFIACQSQEGTAEKAGKKIDETAEEAGKKINETIEKAGEQLEKAGDKAKKATQN